MEPRIEKDYSLWLARMESRAVLPLKWGMLVLCVVYWMGVRGWEPPPTAVFGLFFLYGLVNVAAAVLLWRHRIATDQVRPLIYVSYLADLLFITLLIRFDATMPPPAAGVLPLAGEFHLLYFLLILRGFALFRTTAENLAVAGLVSVLFFLTLFWRGDAGLALAPDMAVLRLGFIWGVMLLAAFVVNIVGRQQEEVLRMRERLVKAESLAALGELAAGVAHEINNPIGIIKTYAEFLKRSTGKEDERLDDYETIEKEAERCENIVRRMLDFARPNIAEMKPVLLQDIAGDVVDFVFHGKKKDNVGAQFLAEGAPPPVLADEGQIRQAILNVVINAQQILKESEKGGTVTVTVRQMSGPRAPVQVTVHDDGPGISPEDAEKVFEPFFTRRSSGTGLGLAITRRIVEAHEGRIEIWPAANGGTTCAITLPVAEAD